jgi:hypothetical protein
MTAPRAIINKLGMFLDKCHQAAWRLKDPSNLAVTRILFGEILVHMPIFSNSLIYFDCVFIFVLFTCRVSYGSRHPY